MQFYQVQFRAVAFVLAEAIFRETRAEVAHNRVARHFRDHARRGDAEAIAIAVDDRSLGQGKRKNREAVDENMLRLNGESVDRRAHRLVSRAQDVDRIDLDGIDDANRPSDGVVRDKILVNLFAFFRQELFRVVQLPVFELLRQNNGRRYDRSRECAASCFVDSSDGGDAERAKFAFMPKTTAPIHGGKILKS